MFYVVEIKEYVRVAPHLFGLDVKEAIITELKDKYTNHISPEVGIVISVKEINEIGEGIIIPGDGAAYYDTTFELVVFKPELQELVYGTVSQITSFGAFLNLGPIEGMIHISQTMDDYVNFSKTNVLMGKNTKRSLKANDLCMARIIAVSFKDPSDPKIGLTMRQPGLGKIEWIEQDKRKQVAEEVKAAKSVKESKEAKGKGKKK
ncbi:MAG: DNA-directed RNA polymerase [Nanoarchaeota archaeon]|nr:DNA-directed RNA polymerase [Nanoarchaeota archaeon]